MKQLLFQNSAFRAFYGRFFAERTTRVNLAIERMKEFQKAGRDRAAWRVQKMLELNFGVLVSRHAKLGRNLQLKHPIGIVIGRGAVIGDNVTIYQNVTIGGKGNDFPVIGDHVAIYGHSSVCGPVEIGPEAVIGTGSVVIKDIPARSVAAGNPCKVIRTL